MRSLREHYRARRIVQSRAEGGEIEFTRIVAFSDGVIAIAITLLVLNLDVPDVPSGDLGNALGDQWRQYLGFALSFALIGRFWILHHRAFTLLERFDATLMVLNLAFLALIVAMPFATDLVAEYGDVPIAVVIYASVVGTASLMSWLMVRRSVRHGHIREQLRPQAEAWASSARARADGGLPRLGAGRVRVGRGRLRHLAADVPARRPGGHPSRS